MLRMLNRFLKARCGVVSLEFAFIAPVFIFLLLGSLGSFDYYRAKRKAIVAADIIADLVARTLTMDDDERDLVFAAADAAMDRYADLATVSFAVHSVEDDGDGDIVVLWSEGNDGTLERSVGSEITDIEFPTIPSGETAIVAEISFSYKSPVAYYMPGALTFEQNSIRRPRYTSIVGYD